MTEHRIYSTSFASIYPHYVTKVERKGRSVDELNEVIRWLTGFTQKQLERQIASEATMREFFDAAKLNPNSSLITGTICGVRIEDIEHPLMKNIRQLDKLVDELAKGRPMTKILRN
mgnify:FL=1